MTSELRKYLEEKAGRAATSARPLEPGMRLVDGRRLYSAAWLSDKPPSRASVRARDL